MELSVAQELAENLLKQHQLSAEWVFKFDHAKRRFGCCNYTKKEISLSKHLTLLNSSEQVRETLLHEIAHALTPGDHHGKKWQAKCIELGIKPDRCYKADEVNAPQARFYLHCANCDLKVPRMRRSRKTYVCKACCIKHNKGKFHERFKLEWYLNDAA